MLAFPSNDKSSIVLNQRFFTGNPVRLLSEDGNFQYLRLFDEQNIYQGYAIKNDDSGEILSWTLTSIDPLAEGKNEFSLPNSFKKATTIQSARPRTAKRSKEARRLPANSSYPGTAFIPITGVNYNYSVNYGSQYGGLSSFPTYYQEVYEADRGGLNDVYCVPTALAKLDCFYQHFSQYTSIYSASLPLDHLQNPTVVDALIDHCAQILLTNPNNGTWTNLLAGAVCGEFARAGEPEAYGFSYADVNIIPYLIQNKTPAITELSTGNSAFTHVVLTTAYTINASGIIYFGYRDNYQLGSFTFTSESQLICATYAAYQ